MEHHAILEVEFARQVANGLGSGERCPGQHDAEGHSSVPKSRRGTQQHVCALRRPQLPEHEDRGGGLRRVVERRHRRPFLIPELPEIAVRDPCDALGRNPELVDQASDRVLSVRNELMAGVVQSSEPLSVARIPAGAVRPEIVNGMHDGDSMSN